MDMSGLLRFPGGKTRALTFGFDDGEIYDRRLARMFREYSLKATFFLISGQLGQKIPFHRYGEDTVVQRLEGRELKDVFRGMEVASHTKNHAAPLEDLEQAVTGSMEELSRLWGRQVTGLAYPGGENSPALVEALRSRDVLYARTTDVTRAFRLPGDLLRWPPTCHYGAEALARDFVGPGDDLRLFYLYGHSYELEDPNPKYGWARFEALCRFLAYREDVWYATNQEIACFLKEKRMEYAK